MIRFLLKYKKPALYILGALALIVALVLILRKRGSTLAQEGVTKAANEIKSQNLTYTASQYSAWADRLFSAMQDIGTDEEAIYSVMRQMKTKDDILSLITAYGVRRIHDRPFIDEDYNLSQALASDLDADEIAKVNGILSSNKINFKF